jgi:hypothetical protein
VEEVIARGRSVTLWALGSVVLLGLLTTLCAAQAAICAPSQNTACVTTWHNDNGRTGQNLNEGKLLYNNLSTFGQLCSVELDGQVYAQPLVLTNVPWGTLGTPNVAYVVTMNDTLYAINGTPPGTNTCQILGSLPFLSTPGLPTNGQKAVLCSQIADKKCTAISPSLGILGTPVIHVSSDGSTATMYLVTYTYDPVGGGFYQELSLRRTDGHGNRPAPVVPVHTVHKRAEPARLRNGAHPELRRYVPVRGNTVGLAKPNG